jgi:hypothetical protein
MILPPSRLAKSALIWARSLIGFGWSPTFSRFFNWTTPGMLDLFCRPGCFCLSFMDSAPVRGPGWVLRTGHPLVNDRRNAMLQQVRLPIHCHPKIAFSLFAALVFVTSIAVAEIEPSYYKKCQQEAPEALLIKVLSELITRYQDEEKTTVFVTIQAQVQSVWRSDSGLSPGTVISIAPRPNSTGFPSSPITSS